MAIESFFVIETSFSDLREKLKEEIVRVDKEYDEITISYHGFFSWMYFYKEGEAYIEEEEKAKLLVNIKKYLKLYLGLTLHPKKIYLQPYKKGLRFLGTFIKPTHIVVNMNIIRNFREAINRGNDLADERRPTKEEMKKFISSINSYLGIMKHYKTYKKRRKLLTKFISQNWKKHVMFVSNFEKIQIKGRE